MSQAEFDGEKIEPKYYFELQASPQCVKLIGWEAMKHIANYLSQGWSIEDFYPERWFLGTLEQRAQAPESIKITFIDWKGLMIKVVPCLDKDSIRVFHFDPMRELHGVREGHHRV